MTRRELLKVCGLFGIGLPSQAMLASCDKEAITPSGFTGTVLIVGAGAAGMAAGYLLEQKGIDFRIIEASATYGGRMKRTTTFVDFPISLGAEWLHTTRRELVDTINNPSTQVATQLQSYQAQDQVGYYENGDLTYANLLDDFGNDFIDKKFLNSSWLDFFEEHIVPSISSRMNFNTQVVSVDYQGSKVFAIDNNGQSYESDKVIVTVPLKVLQENEVVFLPQLPSSHRDAIQSAPVWGGLKVFLAFSAQFYPTYLGFPDSETATGQRIYYDAAYGQNSSSNVLGLFALGEQANQYQTLTGDDQRDYILNELDEIFNGVASQTYVKHIVQDWDNEPYIRSAYLADVASPSISNQLSKAIEGKVYFAGEAYVEGDDWGGVHNATQSARDVISEFA